MRKFSYNFKPNLSKQKIKLMAKFMSSSYIASIISGAPLLLLPLLVLNKLGSEQAAYYYITATISMLLNIIPSAITQSLFAEGSWGVESLKSQALKSLKFMYCLTIPLVIVLIVFGREVLGIFGKNFSNQGYELLVLIAITALPKVISYLLSTIIKLSGKLRPLVIVSILGATTVLGTSYIMVDKYGLLGIGFATIIGEIFVVVSYSLIVLHRLRNKKLLSA
jgi:O-antigen/teichoic acid export membrane protein